MTFLGITCIYGNGILNSILIRLDSKYYWDTLNYSKLLRAPAGSSKVIEMEVVGRSSSEVRTAEKLRRPSLTGAETSGNELVSILAEGDNQVFVESLDTVISLENKGKFVTENSVFKHNYQKINEIIMEESRNKVEF